MTNYAAALDKAALEAAESMKIGHAFKFAITTPYGTYYTNDYVIDKGTISFKSAGFKLVLSYANCFQERCEQICASNFQVITTK